MACLDVGDQRLQHPTFNRSSTTRIYLRITHLDVDILGRRTCARDLDRFAIGTYTTMFNAVMKDTIVNRDTPLTAPSQSPVPVGFTPDLKPSGGANAVI